MKLVKHLKYLCAFFFFITLLHAADEDTGLCIPFKKLSFTQCQCATRMLLDLVEEPGNFNLNTSNVVAFAQTYTQLGYLNVAHRFLCAAQESGCPEIDKEKEKIYFLLTNSPHAHIFYYKQQNDEDAKKLCRQYAEWRSTVSLNTPVVWRDGEKAHSQSTGTLPDLSSFLSTPGLTSSNSPLESRSKLKGKLCRRMSHETVKEKSEKLQRRIQKTLERKN